MTAPIYARRLQNVTYCSADEAQALDCERWCPPEGVTPDPRRWTPLPRESVPAHYAAATKRSHDPTDHVCVGGVTGDRYPL